MCGFPKIDIRCAISTIALIYLIVSVVNSAGKSERSSSAENSDVRLKQAVAQYLQEQAIQDGQVIVVGNGKVLLAAQVKNTPVDLQQELTGDVDRYLTLLNKPF
jgi:sulfur carrier protein ThiS